MLPTVRRTFLTSTPIFLQCCFDNRFAHSVSSSLRSSPRRRIEPQPDPNPRSPNFPVPGTRPAQCRPIQLHPTPEPDPCGGRGDELPQHDEPGRRHVQLQRSKTRQGWQSMSSDVVGYQLEGSTPRRKSICTFLSSLLMLMPRAQLPRP